MVTALLTFMLSAAGDNQCCVNDSVRLLRATTSNPDSVPREGAFSFTGPDAWNQPPATLRATPNLNSFKKQLKTHLFNKIIAFSH